MTKKEKNTTAFSSLHFLDDVSVFLTFSMPSLSFLPPIHTHTTMTTQSTITQCPVLFAELPYGWEEIDDPQYGTYYVE